MATATARQSNEQYVKLRRLLCEANYSCAWVQEIKELYQRPRLECWIGERGVLIIQAWKEGGVDVYCSQGIPNEWAALGEWLKGAQLAVA